MSTGRSAEPAFWRAGIAAPRPHRPDPKQLSFGEGVALLHQIRDFGDPLPQLILTGGDPLERHDLFGLGEYAGFGGKPRTIFP